MTKQSLWLLTTAVLLSLSSSLALGSTEDGDIIDLITGDGLKWLHSLITAGLLIKAFLAIYDKWEAIFQGTDIIKNLLVIAGWMVAALYWKAILIKVGSLTTAGGL
jgi:hypothetical protein